MKYIFNRCYSISLIEHILIINIYKIYLPFRQSEICSIPSKNLSSLPKRTDSVAWPANTSESYPGSRRNCRPTFDRPRRPPETGGCRTKTYRIQSNGQPNDPALPLQCADDFAVSAIQSAGPCRQQRRTRERPSTGRPPKTARISGRPIRESASG